jgi:putative transposase
MLLQCVGMIDQILRLRPIGKLFFTVRLQDRHSNLLVQAIERLRHATRKTLNAMPFEIDEIVVLPGAIHTIWTLPEGDADFSKRWRMLKSQFSRGLPAVEVGGPSDFKPYNKGIWQRRFWEYHLRDDEDLEAHRQMIHFAPVQAGLVKRPEEWPHSSIHRAVRLGRGPFVSRVGENPRAFLRAG